MSKLSLVAVRGLIGFTLLLRMLSLCVTLAFMNPALCLLACWHCDVMCGCRYACANAPGCVRRRHSFIMASLYRYCIQLHFVLYVHFVHVSVLSALMCV